MSEQRQSPATTPEIISPTHPIPAAIPVKVESVTVKPPIEKVAKQNRKNSKRRSDFPRYIPGVTCIKQGKQHQYVDRGSYDECKVCGSSRMHYESKKKTSKKQKTSKKGSAAPTAESTTSPTQFYGGIFA